MKKIWIVLLSIFAVLVLIFLWFSGKYNTLVGLQEKTSEAWAQVENVYQRRADLIPNLVKTVQGVANFEKETLTQVVEARAKATSVTVDPTKLSPDQIQKFESAQGGLSQALGRLMVVVERYPELKATQNFSELQAQLEGTENRITVERQKFNTVVQEYNTSVRSFPTNLIAAFTNFTVKGYFQAKAGAEEVPVVDFGTQKTK